MIVIGKIKEIYNDENVPSIKELIQDKPIKSKEIVLNYLKSGKKGAVAAGHSTDVLTGDRIEGGLCC